MAYTRKSNIPAGRGQHARDQGSANRWFQEHTFTVEITTVPQSLHALIRAQTDGGNPVQIYTQRVRVEFANPADVPANPTIYVSRGGPHAAFMIDPGGTQEAKCGPQMDFLVWCSAGTAALVFTELG